MQQKAWLVASAVSVMVFASLVAGIGRPGPKTDLAPASTKAGEQPASAATAPDALPPPTPAMVLEPVFDILDCDRENMIDRGQVDEHFGQLFAPRDTDRSHTLSLGEYLAGSQGILRKRREVAFGQADANRDGKLTADEFIAHLHALVDVADADKNGDVTRQELIATRGPADQPGS